MTKETYDKATELFGEIQILQDKIDSYDKALIEKTSEYAFSRDELIHELAKCKDVQLNIEGDAYYIRQSEVFRTVNDAPTIEGRKKGIWTTHEVACLLAEVIGDDCACNVNGNDEWLPYECIFAQNECPNVGVACWEQWLIHRKEKHNEQTNRC